MTAVDVGPSVGIAANRGDPNAMRWRVAETEKRYAKRARARGSRRRNLATLGHGGDWRKVDEPERVMRRLLDLGLTAVASEAMAAEPVILERIIKGNQLLGADFFVRGAMATRSVGRVVIRDLGGATLGYGTGSLVTPELLMTNNHVLGSAAAAYPSTIQFDFIERHGRLRPVQEFRLLPGVFFATDLRLDFTLVAVERLSLSGVPLGNRPWSPLIATSGKAIVGERMNLIQHPAGRPQEVSVRDNTVVDVFDDFLHYTSDTEQGSSGSPAFNDQWVTAALHHSGVPMRDDDGRILLDSGLPWDGSDETIPQIAWRANEGIRISSIVDHLQAQADTFTGPARVLLDELFAAEAPPLDSYAEASPADDDRNHPPQGGTLTGPGMVQGQLDADGRVRWVLPLEITASLAPAPSVATPPVVVAAGSGRPTTSIDPDDVAGLAADAAALAAALARLAETDADTYYDEQRDATDRDAYYVDIDENLSATERFDQLSDLVRRTHHTELSYETARLQHLYPVVDRRPPPALDLVSIYSNVGFDPEELIHQELLVEAQRGEMIRRFATSESYAGEASFERFLENLETVAPFNCEHVVPQSWFDARNPMRADLHHLFTCEPGCNSFRGNIGYFQFGPEDEAVRNGCGRREDDKFEPEEGKGAVARATLYFLLRYPGLIGDQSRELGPERLHDVLLRWHDEHPPDLWEHHRNAEIMAVQGNRNPFIDHPDWAVDIDFSSGFGR